MAYVQGQSMDRTVWSTRVAPLQGSEIILLKVPAGSVARRWDAQRVINAARTRLPLAQLAWDVVVLVGDPESDAQLFGSSPEAESYVRQLGSQLQSYPWQSKVLNW